MEMLLDDLRYGLRSLRKAPAFAGTGVLALALGIGANVAIFSLVDSLLLRPLPLSHPENLVEVWEDNSFLGFPRDTPAPANFADWKERNHVFSDMGALNGQIFAITGDGVPEQVEGNPVTANLFPLLGVDPILGRNILPEEDRPGNNRVVLISHRLWQQRYGANPAMIGREILLDGVAHRVIGVMPRGFAILERSDVWVPMALTPERLAMRSSHYLIVFARLRPGVTRADAQRDMWAIASQLAAEYPKTNRHVGAVVTDLREDLLGNVHLAIWVLAGGVGSVLLISCANLAGLMLARAAGRQREMAIRTALGASRYRMIGQVLAESLLIAFAGGALGMLLASWIVPFLGRLVPTVLAVWAQPRVDGRLLVFTFLASVVSALLFGALPGVKLAFAWDAGGSLASVLQRGGRAAIGGYSRFRRFLVAGEVALAVVVCVGAGLMVQTVWRLAHVDLGFRPEGVLTMRTSLPDTANYRGFPARNNFYQGVLERVQALPGVVSAGYTTFLPLTNRGGTSGFVVEGAPPLPPGELNDANRRVVSTEYLQTIGVRLVAGRWFNPSDDANAQPVAIINQAMARQFWAGTNPLGRRFRLGDNGPWFTIVGLAGDIRQMGIDVAGRAEMYFPSTQAPASVGYFTPRDLAVRVKGDPLQLAPAVRQAVWSVDRNQPISDVQPLTALVDRDLSAQTTQLWLLGSFALLGLILAAIGLYGLLSHLVLERTRDIGVRMALGARRSQVLLAVMKQGLGLVACGLALGAVGAAWQTSLMRKLLYGVKPTDAGTFGAVAFTLLAVGAIACYLPARRATRIDPMHALRHE